jgi:ATP-dependent Clp protease ATP-binding subunit ClpX
MSKGIIFIDEIDKISSHSVGVHNSNRDVSGLSVQQELLKILDGETVNYEGRFQWHYQDYSFDTRYILFILAGAFNGLEEIISKRIKNSKRIGFITQKQDEPFSETDRDLIFR